MRDAYRILAVKSLRKWPLGRPKQKWKKHFKMDLREVCCENGGGWNWFRIMCNGRNFGFYSQCINSYNYRHLLVINVKYVKTL
jgi:hypothetical protein